MAVLVALAALSTLSLNMFLPALDRIAQDLGVSLAAANLVFAGYLVASALVHLLGGSLSDRYGRRPVLLAALALYAAGSLICAMATSLPAMLAGRILQSAIAAGYALSLAMLRDTRPEAETSRAVAGLSMALAIGPLIGPALGGVLSGAVGWRAIFWLYTLCGAGLLTWCALCLPETRKAQAGAAAPRPTALLAEPRFWAPALTMALSVGAFYVFLTGLPIVAAATRALTPEGLGAALGSITAGYLAGSTASRHLARRARPFQLILAGRMIALAGLGAGVIGALIAGPLPVPWLLAATAAVGVGNGLTTPSASLKVMAARPGLQGSAAGGSAALTVGLGGALSGLVAGPLLTRSPDDTALLGLMFAVSLLGLVAALWARALDASD